MTSSATEGRSTLNIQYFCATVNFEGRGISATARASEAMLHVQAPVRGLHRSLMVGPLMITHFVRYRTTRYSRGNIFAPYCTRGTASHISKVRCRPSRGMCLGPCEPVDTSDIRRFNGLGASGSALPRRCRCAVHRLRCTQTSRKTICRVWPFPAPLRCPRWLVGGTHVIRRSGSRGPTHS